MSVIQTSYAATAIAFGLLVIAMLFGWRRYSPHPLLIVAGAMTAVWGGIIVYAAQAPVLGNLLSASETLRSGAWILFLSSLLIQFWRQSNSLNYTFVLSMMMAFIFTLQVVIDFGALQYFGINLAYAPLQDLIVQLYIFGRLTVAITGMVLLENLYRSTDKMQKWKLRPLGLGIGGLFVYDIVLYAQALLFSSIDADLFAARGFINAMAAPLLFISVRRMIEWKFDVVLSQRAVFHSLSLLVTGFYLVIMALAGFALRQFGGSWGAVLQIAFLCAAAVGLLYIFFSDSARAWLRVVLGKYFRRYKYDYRDVWLKFIRKIDASETESSLQARVLEGVCNITDSQGGMLYLNDGSDEFTVAENWNFRSDIIASERQDGALAHFLNDKRWIIDLNELRDSDPRYAELEVPEWVALEPRAWLIIPLFREHLIGYIITRQPRVPRTLDWEDHDLLKTIGMQSASYITEQKSQVSLAESEQFDAFNRRFAFIMHDLKNLVSQLSLMSRNVKKYGHDPEFQADMAETLESSVDKITNLLAKLHQAPETATTRGAVDVCAVASSVAQGKKNAHARVSVSLREPKIVAHADAEKLEQVLTHLVQNAIDASEPGKPVTLSVAKQPDTVEVRVEDHGTGMSSEFIQKQLFKPFSSTKTSGFGIGAYESRELVRQMGGHLSVTSQLGEGTQFVIKLPTVAVEN